MKLTISDLAMYGVLLLLAGMSAYLVYTQFKPPGASHGQVVSLDPTRLANAQRAIAAGLITSEDTDVLVALNRIGRQSQSVIQEIAGPQTIVLVKQAIVAGDVYDITDEVLEALGLPTDVPTVDPMRYVEDVAPVDIGLTIMREATARNEEQRLREHNEGVADDRLQRSTELLP
ncbi:OmpH family outer membrane protein [Thioalkalivibrio thiocyanodenitrificans]|uniref:hypothetical protein n=1 Tax=Thioalkalivibrio thiocyanodenitrificans TaxID=243063 RepID=UPI00038196F8|nr:hypothetical protein [Thioalkalivibrio thiocyanodenitrificans]